MYFCELSYTSRSNMHGHDTRYADLIDIESTRTVMAEQSDQHISVKLEHVHFLSKWGQDLFSILCSI